MKTTANKLTQAENRVTHIFMVCLAGQIGLKRPDFDRLYKDTGKLRSAIRKARILSGQRDQKRSPQRHGGGAS
jgi:hypothetical protein